MWINSRSPFCDERRLNTAIRTVRLPEENWESLSTCQFLRQINVVFARGRHVVAVSASPHLMATNMEPDARKSQIMIWYTGADIANLVNEAAIVATRRKGDSIGTGDFTEAIERIVAGLEKKSRVLNAEERRRVAYHEMGHALVAATLPGVDPVQKVSIIPRGVGALGYTIQRPTEDRFLLGKVNLENRIAVLMGGRASEQLVFGGDVSTGAADDLQRATEIALEMVTRYGMDDKVGQRTYAPEPQPFMPAPLARHVQAAEVTTREIDVAVRDLLAEAFSARHRPRLPAVLYDFARTGVLVRTRCGIRHCRRRNADHRLGGNVAAVGDLSVRVGADPAPLPHPGEAFGNAGNRANEVMHMRRNHRGLKIAGFRALRMQRTGVSPHRQSVRSRRATHVVRFSRISLVG
jgi:Peptidase family M41/AAA+ lid domain